MNHVYAVRRTFSLIVILLGFLSFSFAQTTFTVTTTAATGAGSLEQAILDANSNPGMDNIVFAIAGPPPYVITPGFPGLSPITESVNIDGYTQTGAATGPIGTRTILIYINGAAAGFSHGLTINADLVTVSGLAIGGFLRNGIQLAGGVADDFIWGNFIGTDPTGVTAAGNNGDGISMGETVGGSDAIIIGTNSDGTNDDAEGNLIAANGRDGILGWTVSNCIISGNFIGSNRFAVGAAGFGNTRNGILLTVSSSANRIGTNGDNNNDVQELNGIVRNGVGITLAASSNLNAVSGNLIGVQVPPTFTAAGNIGDGITIINSNNNRIGINPAHANPAAESNVISSNGGNGITISAQDFLSGFNTDPSADNIVAGNFIGTTPLNDSRGNGGNGVSITSTDGIANTANIIGSNNDGTGDNAEANVIANNSVIGVAIGNDPPAGGPTEISGNTVSRNSIHDNGALGIDIVGTIGVTANDNGDGDTGPNELYNFPVITSNHGDGENLKVTGISRPNAIIEVYLSDGSGEGATFLFRAQEGTTINGIADNLGGTAMYSDPVYGTFTDNAFEFEVSLTAMAIPIPPGAQLVAIGIDANGSVSEFGPQALILPVTLISFKGQLNDGVAKLSWTTSREINSSHFVVEKSIDGTNYISVGQVNTGMAGGQYSFVDKTALGKINYYRLRIVDTDLNYAFSKIVVLRNDAEPVVFKLSPNPVSTYLYVSFKLDKEEVIKLNIYDQMGRLTKRYNLQGGKGINAFTLSDLGNLAGGNYVVELLGETLSVREKIIKK